MCRNLEKSHSLFFLADQSQRLHASLHDKLSARITLSNDIFFEVPCQSGTKFHQSHPQGCGFKVSIFHENGQITLLAMAILKLPSTYNGKIEKCHLLLNGYIYFDQIFTSMFLNWSCPVPVI